MSIIRLSSEMTAMLTLVRKLLKDYHEENKAFQQAMKASGQEIREKAKKFISLAKLFLAEVSIQPSVAPAGVQHRQIYVIPDSQ